MPSISGSGRIRLSFPAGMGCSVDLSSPGIRRIAKSWKCPPSPPASPQAERSAPCAVREALTSMNRGLPAWQASVAVALESGNRSVEFFPPCDEVEQDKSGAAEDGNEAGIYPPFHEVGGMQKHAEQDRQTDGDENDSPFERSKRVWLAEAPHIERLDIFRLHPFLYHSHSLPVAPDNG